MKMSRVLKRGARQAALDTFVTPVKNYSALLPVQRAIVTRGGIHPA